MLHCRNGTLFNRYTDPALNQEPGKFKDTPKGPYEFFPKASLSVQCLGHFIIITCYAAVKMAKPCKLVLMIIALENVMLAELMGNLME